MAKRSMFVGMDVHKDSIDISLAEEGRTGEVRHYGRTAGDLEALARVVKARSGFIDEAQSPGGGTQNSTKSYLNSPACRTSSGSG